MKNNISTLKKLQLQYKQSNLNYKLPVILGIDESGETEFADLTVLKHILMTGSSGSGKSMFLHTIIYNFIQSFSPHEITFILVDMKLVELTIYEGSPYLLTPPIADKDKFYSAIKWVAAEKQYRMEDKEKVEKGPYIVVIIDTFSDLMTDEDNDFQEFLKLLLDGAADLKIHFIMSDSRTSPEVFTADIRNLFPTKICFSVADAGYSKLLIGKSGGEDLKGNGDMLFSQQGSKEIIRLQAPFVPYDEMDKLLEFIRSKDS